MSNFYRDAFVDQCPFCGGTEMIETYQPKVGVVSASANSLLTAPKQICHTVCRRCGSIVRSYVKDPEGLLSRSESKGFR